MPLPERVTAAPSATVRLSPAWAVGGSFWRVTAMVYWRVVAPSSAVTDTVMVVIAVVVAT